MPPSLSLLEGLVCSVFVRLTCKLANILNGLNVTNEHVGDVLEVTEAEGFMLLAEGWGERVSDQTATELSSESDSEERLQA